ncbi:MAG TPA: choice-of-anchor D domain-containing protein [Burkholderiaceae bacterium]|nr:choice-of-anchor D domain-containing protein [Burkholderiaceae bacterium]
MSAGAARRIAGLFAAATSVVAPAFAQTAADGYSIYQNGIYKGNPIGAPACATCHGQDPLHSQQPGLLNAAGNPTFLVNVAWQMAPMNQFDYPAKIDANGQMGIATYLLYPPAGTQPFSLFAAQSLDFGDVVVGQTPPPKQMVLTNIGPQPLTAVTIQASPSATGVTESNDCPATLASQTSCTITVTFAPLAAGKANAGYVVSASNDANAGDEFFVFANGVTSAPPPPPPPPPPSSSGGGGALDLEWLLLGLLPISGRRRPASRTER